jgi:hypothetical protein
MTLQATLVTDGSSDTVLLPILAWLFASLTPADIEIRWADLRGLRNPPTSPGERLSLAVDLYPCDVLFVHRDAEKQDPQLRRAEIATANRTGHPHVCVVPVRMQEAWLLLDEAALREAAGRPSGTEDLGLPGASRWEALADPKATLHSALRVASGARGRRAGRFNPDRAAHRLAELVSDWSRLSGLTAFVSLRDDTLAAFDALGVPLHAAVDRRGNKGKDA